MSKENEAILIVDDEKNIRLMLRRTFEVFGRPINVAVNGDDALQQLEKQATALMLLDLKMPGIDGMEVLRRVSERWPQVRVIIVTAHGTVASAVEAMKLGAVDFIQKPFSPEEVRQLARSVLEREAIDPAKAHGYADHIALARRCVNERRLSAALEHARKAVSADPGSSEGFNLLGALHEILGDVAEAQKSYRIALDLDPTNEVAAKNLQRSVRRSWDASEGRRPDLG
jgi:DNA-binding NtrC family response regulator